MTKLKICGIREKHSLDTCLDLNIDWVGFNFSPKSKRLIHINNYIQLVSRYPNYLLEGKKVFLFYQNTIQDIHDILDISKPDFIQFIYGDISPLLARDISINYNIPIIWQLGVSRPLEDSDLDFGEYAFPILDKHSEMGGGTGKSFPWDWITNVRRKFLLAGGLRPENVQSAIKTLNPWGVDVASGVESKPGQKESYLIREFVNNVRSK
jgi:phosphoribosylanthranilate isomerase